ncbi:MAG: NAD(P)H-dependent oxidoreductase, partial [Clostridium sp.]|uniref:NAD(P)H-dependent oxidoreductase n=1 Tax=Clostridium sp. TaxID=1506 RepID=UPI003EE7D2EA
VFIMKTLIIIAHPNMEASKINKIWKNRLDSEENITIHDLYSLRKKGPFNILEEQELLLNHDRIIYQFPFHWYSAPALLKEWQDDVLAFGFSHGPNGNKLNGKEFMLVISAGGQESAYRAGGYQHYNIDELTRPYQAMATFTGMKFLPTYALYSTHTLSDEQVQESADVLANIALSTTI